MPKFKYSVELLGGADIDDDLVKQCAALFSNHYAKWDAEADRISGGRLVNGGSLFTIELHFSLIQTRSASKCISRFRQETLSW